MKRILLPALTLCMLSAKAQYSESFSAGTLSYNNNSVGDIPSNMVQIKNNSNAYATNVSVFAAPNNSKGFMTALLGNGDTVAIASSWYNPAGRSDNWLMTPIITGITANTMLVWNDISSSSQYTDSISVLVSTSSSTTPAIADFTTTVFPLTKAGNVDQWATRAISLANYAGQSIRIAFNHKAYDGEYLFLDDIRTANVTTQRDIAVNQVLLPKYTDANVTVKATIQSFGFQPVTSFRLNYQVGTNTPVAQTFNNGLTYLAGQTVSFTTPAAVAANANIKVWVDQINNQSDENAANDMQQKMVYFIANKPPKNVVIEEFTGAWCQFCPDGQTVLNETMTNVPGVFGASVHNNDAMVNTDAQVIDQQFATGYPSGLIDRYYFEGQTDVATSRTDWQSLAQQRKAHPVPVKVSFTNKTYNASTRQLSITVKAEFVAAVSGDYRIGAIIVEDDVYNSANVTGWNQVNAYNTQSSSEWYQKGNPIVGFKHKHVVEAMLGGTWGEAGVIAANVTNGQSFTKTFTWTVPAKTTGPIYRWNENNMHIIGYVSEYDADVNQRPILNSDETHLVWPLSINNTAAVINATKVYPNPAKDQVTLALELKDAYKVALMVYDAFGKVVFEKPSATLPAGANAINIPTANFATGMYTIKIATQNGTISEVFSVIK